MSALFRARAQHRASFALSRHHGAVQALLGLILTLTPISTTLASAASSASSGTPCFASLQSETAHISRVSDGDTIVLKDDRRVRLIGINTAELNSRDPELKKAAQRAAAELATLLPAGTAVTLFLGEESHDRHGRVLAHVVRTKDELAVASVLVSTGFAVQSAVAPNTLCAPHFAQLERKAASTNAGDWDKLTLFDTKAAELIGNERGFHFVTGRVSSVVAHKRYTEVFLNEKFRLLLRPTLAKAMPVAELQGQTVQVRGWLNQRKNKPFLWLQHQSNLRVLEP